MPGSSSFQNKYFPDVEAIMTAWHARQIDAHLGLLAAARDRGGMPGQPRERRSARRGAHGAIPADRQTHAETASGRPLPSGETRMSGQPVGGMFWLPANTLPGSHRRLSATSRRQVSSP